MGNFDVVLEPVRAFLVQIGGYLPRLAVALVVVLVGALVGKAMRFALVKTLRALNFHVLTARSGVDAFVQQGGTERDTTDFIGRLGYWVVILIALIIAFNGLGLSQITDVLTRVLLFVPKLLVSLLVIILGSYFGRFVGAAVQSSLRSAGTADAELIGRVVHYAIIVFVVLIAVDQLDIGGNLVQHTFLILLAGVVLALALAFGIGGRERAAEMLQRWFPRRSPPDERR